MCEDRKTTSSILFCDVQTADAFKESILDGSGFEYLCKHPRIASFPTWPSSCSKSVQGRLESGCFSFFLAWWFGYGCSLEGEKDSPNSLRWTPINQYQQQSWYILIYIKSLPQKYSINAAKGFSSVLHISGACSHCSHCHLSAVYPSSHRTAGTSSRLSGAAPPADVTTASKPFPLGQEQSFWMLEVSRVQGFKGNPRVNDHDMQWWQWYSYDHLDISYLSIKSPAARGGGVEASLSSS